MARTGTSPARPTRAGRTTSCVRSTTFPGRPSRSWTRARSAAEAGGMKTLAVLLAIPTLLLGWLHLRDGRIESKLEPVASAIAGRDVSVDCQGYFGSLVEGQARHGEVRFDAAGEPEPRIFLTRSTCGRLRRFASGTRGELACLAELDWARPTPLVPGGPCYEQASPTIYAVLVLAHEAYHTAGSTDEAAT